MDIEAKRRLVSIDPTSNERAVLRAGGTVQRVIKLAFVSDRYAAAYVGETTLTPGAAHANNSLSCETYDRANGRPLKLDDVLGSTRALAVQREASARLEESLPAEGYDMKRGAFLFDAANARIVLCAEAPFSSAGTIVEVVVDLGG